MAFFRAALALAAALAVAFAQADERLRIDVDDANPPFMYADHDRAAGVYPALLRAVFADMGVPMEVQPRPWLRALAELDAGSAGVAGIYKNAERLRRYDYSEVLFVERVNAYVRAGGRRVDGPADLAGRRVGVIRGWSYGDAFDALRRTGAVTVEEVSSDGQNFAKLDAGRLDAVLAIAEAAEPLLRRHASLRFAGTVTENPTYLAFGKGAHRLGLIARFNASLARLRAAGRVRQIVGEQLARD
ncbi:MAG TPA: transporter substrate-binding domain-containing protein [Albitalea sp.]|nr:transporter substrate-binding domain-containing protein [Albitalea sp.]